MTGQPRLSIIPGWCHRDRRLKGMDLYVLCELGSSANTKSGWTRRSQVKLSEELGCARSTVQASLNRLIEIGAVERYEEKSACGRDSAHWYRVIYDREPPGGYALGANQGNENEEDFPTDEPFEGAPPAGIPAPPAGPESAPPAGSGPAPINASCLTPPDKRIERERAPEGSERDGKAAPAGESRAAVLRAFNIWYAAWPEKRSIPKTAEEAWFELSREERAECIDRTPDYIASFGKTRISTYAAVYLRDRMWKRLPPKAPPAQPAERVAPFGKGGMAYRLWIMNQPERPHPTPPWMVQRILDEGGPAADAEIVSRRESYSWPRLHELNRRMTERDPIHVAADIVVLGADFVSTEIDGPVGQAWKRWFAKVRLPWLPMEPQKAENGHRYAYLPPIGTAGGSDTELDKAVAAAWWNFAERCKEHADAA